MDQSHVHPEDRESAREAYNRILTEADLLTLSYSQLCRPSDFLARHGGEEFIICLINTNQEQAKRVAERMRRAVEDLVITLPEESAVIRLTASFGVVSSAEGESIEELIQQANRRKMSDPSIDLYRGNPHLLT